MKRKDKFTKDEILEIFYNFYDKENRCKYCINEPDSCNSVACLDNVKTWLEQEIETKSRIATINTVDEFNNAKEEYRDYCRRTDCSNCKYAEESWGQYECFSKFLAEEVEV